MRDPGVVSEQQQSASPTAEPSQMDISVAASSLLQIGGKVTPPLPVLPPINVNPAAAYPQQQNPYPPPQQYPGIGPPPAQAYPLPVSTSYVDNRKPDLKTGFRGKTASLVPLPETELLDHPLFAKAEVDRAQDGRRRRTNSATGSGTATRARSVRKASKVVEDSDASAGGTPGPSPVLVSSGYGKLEFLKGSEPEGMRPHVYKPRGTATAASKRRAVSMFVPGAHAQQLDSDSDDDGDGDGSGEGNMGGGGGGGSDQGGNADPESNRIVRRRERNALAAQRSRERKRLYTEKLENRISDLERYAAELEATIRQLGGRIPGGSSRKSSSDGFPAPSFTSPPPPHHYHSYAPQDLHQPIPVPHPIASASIKTEHSDDSGVVPQRDEPSSSGEDFNGSLKRKRDATSSDPDAAISEAIAATTARLEGEFERRMAEIEKDWLKKKGGEVPGATGHAAPGAGF